MFRLFRPQIFLRRVAHAKRGFASVGIARGFMGAGSKGIGLGLVGFGITSSYLLHYQWNQTNCLAESPAGETDLESGSIETDASGSTHIKGLPLYTKADVFAHKTKETGIWVTYKDGVYDITDFLAEHPGGNKIMLAAGGPIDPFWAIYQQHTTKMVLARLKKLRIGNLKVEPGQVFDVDDPYSTDPTRHPALKVLKQKPFNAESPTELFMDNFITPNALWYVRHHHPVPVIDPKEYRLKIKGLGIDDREFSLEELRTLFPKRSVTTTLVCGGHRRAEYKVKTEGLMWVDGAVSTATYSGASVRDVLLHCGLDPDTTEAEHVWFVGADAPYDASVPITKAVGKRGDVLLAYEMNGVDVPPDHGFPIRAVTPGIVGARNVKWVDSVVVSKEESKSSWQRGVAYKGLSPSVTKYDGLDLAAFPGIQENPVHSAIVSPLRGESVDVDTDEVEVKGWALSGGGRGIVRVDVSADGGQNWTTADLKRVPDQKVASGRSWAWTFWEADVPIPESARVKGNKVELVCKAVDTSYNTQPERTEPIWNKRGILNNSWFRREIDVVDDDDEV